MRNIPKCEMNHGKCVRMHEGRCMALRDTLFTGPCPFFQTEAEFKESSITSIERLIKLDRFDLIEKYYRTPPVVAIKMSKTRDGIRALAMRSMLEESDRGYA